MKKYPLFHKNDLTAFWALFSDNLANIVILSGICITVFKMPQEIVFGKILPGLGVSLIVGISAYVYLAKKLAEKENRNDVTALPYGISTPVMFTYLFAVIGPIYWKLSSLGIENASIQAWQIGIAAAFLGGIIEMLGSIFGTFLKKITPRAGMLGTLAGIALVWIATVPFAEIFENPIVGFASITIVFGGLIAGLKMPFKLPAGLIAIIVGTIISFLQGHSKIIISDLSINIPIPVFNDLLNGFQLIIKHPFILTVILPIEIYNFIETMNNVESAEVAGDKYNVSKCQIIDGLGTIVGSLFGSAFPTTVYIGHPAYKRLKARSGYSLGVGIVIFISVLFGLINFLYNLIPIAAVAPMLIFVGLIITAQAFNSNEKKYSVAVAISLIPHISNLLTTKLHSGFTALNQKITPELISAMKNQGIHWLGQTALSQGAIITGLFWGAIVSFIIDLKYIKAASFSIVAALLTLFGIIHSSNLGINFTQIFFGYLIMTILLLLAHKLKLERDSDISEF